MSCLAKTLRGLLTPTLRMGPPLHNVYRPLSLASGNFSKTGSSIWRYGHSELRYYQYMIGDSEITSLINKVFIVDSLRYFIGPLSEDTVPNQALETLRASETELPDMDTIMTNLILKDSSYRAQYIETWEKTGVCIVHQTVGIVGQHQLAFERVVSDIAFWIRLSVISQKIRIILHEKDILDVKRKRQLGVILGIQDAGFLSDRLHILETLYNLGLRIIQPTYNIMNDFGTGCLERVDAGLSYQGIRLIKMINDLGMVIDASHCSWKTTMDILEVSKDPIIFSHVTCKAVYPHDRGKTDEELAAVAQEGGYIGIALVPAFLTSASCATIKDFLKHLKHAIDVCGIDHVGIGTDWGAVYPKEIIIQENKRAASVGFRPEHRLNFGCAVEGFKSWSDWPNIIRALTEEGYNLTNLRKILGNNFLNVFKRVVK